MVRERTRYSGDFKAKVALETIKGQRSVNEIASAFGVHAKQVTYWKQQLLEHARDVFSNGHVRRQQEEEQLRAQLYQQIGQLKVEVDFLEKKLGISR